MSKAGDTPPDKQSGGPSLVDGKNNSRDADASECEQSGSQSCDAVGETGGTEQSDLEDHIDLTEEDRGRYDCRYVYQNMELEAEDGETAHFRCGSWDCYCCAHRMRMNFIEELERLVDERPELRRFLTLTLDPERAPDDQGEKHRYLTERFNALRTELNDRYDNLSYLWVREEGEGGNPHLHLIVDRYMPQDELSALSRRVGLGEVVDIRRVNARNMAKYLTKYLTKGSMADLPKGARRYGSSQDIDLAVRGGSGDSRRWDFVLDDYQNMREGEPLRRSVDRMDLMIQREWGGPVPPDWEVGEIDGLSVEYGPDA
jgi:hypothetical protein